MIGDPVTVSKNKTAEEDHQLHKFVIDGANEALKVILEKVMTKPEEQRFLLSQRIASAVFQIHHRVILEPSVDKWCISVTKEL